MHPAFRSISLNALILLLGAVASPAQTRLNIEWEKSLGGRQNETDVKGNIYPMAPIICVCCARAVQ